MAKSICARCGESVFEQATVLNCAVLQCARCGAVVGSLNAAPLQDAKLDQISQQVHRIDAGLRAIVEALNKL